ncbi:MAG: domain containing protein [Sediminibacterium sp.]|nr:domain containing protein [Sediminibacterium sp.]
MHGQHSAVLMTLKAAVLQRCLTFNVLLTKTLAANPHESEMKSTRMLFCCFLLLGHFFSVGQNFSNKGKDFWLGYGFHVNMGAGVPTAQLNQQDMILYFTSNKNATVTVEMPANGYKQTYTVVANQVTVSNPLPKSGTQDARIIDTGLYNRGIHVYSDVDIVAYGHIYNSSVSGASLLFPTNTLGKDY